MSRTLVIIPAYNEEDNIVRLVRALRALDAHPDVLVVDDGNDRTADLVRAEGAADPGAMLKKREGKGGRGTAVLDGIAQGLEQGYDMLVEMDADFSHDPAALPQLLALAESNAVVIGSRYRPGSRIENWPLGRRVFSRLANIYAGLVLGIGISDYTNGYRVYGREAAQKIDRTRIQAKGYIVLSEIAWQLHNAGCRFKEIPITFVNRTRGVSNFTWREVKESLTSVWRIRLRKS
jgi:dolichol-phosphate mannosyltransferase